MKPADERMQHGTPHFLHERGELERYSLPAELSLIIKRMTDGSLP